MSKVVILAGRKAQIAVRVNRVAAVELFEYGVNIMLENRESLRIYADHNELDEYDQEQAARWFGSLVEAMQEVDRPFRGVVPC